MQNSTEFDEIYRLYAADLYRFIVCQCKNETLAEDILQDTMLKAFTSIGGFKGECSVKTWLYAIAKNVYRDHLKKAENRNLPLDELPEFPETGSLEEQIADRETALRIHRFLHELDEPYKEIFSLRIFAELKFSEIGGLFNQTESWARVMFFRAKKELIALMQKEDAL